MGELEQYWQYTYNLIRKSMATAKKGDCKNSENKKLEI